MSPQGPLAAAVIQTHITIDQYKQKLQVGILLITGNANMFATKFLLPPGGIALIPCHSPMVSRWFSAIMSAQRVFPLIVSELRGYYY